MVQLYFLQIMRGYPSPVEERAHKTELPTPIELPVNAPNPRAHTNPSPRPNARPYSPRIGPASARQPRAYASTLDERCVRPGASSCRRWPIGRERLGSSSLMGSSTSEPESAKVTMPYMCVPIVAS